MRLRCQTSADLLEYEENQVLGAGGQATVYAAANDPRLALKIYRKATSDLIEKLRIMIRNPPVDSGVGKAHASIAWPIDLLLQTGPPYSPVGFAMPRVNRMRPIVEFYNPKTRRLQCPGFNYLYLHRTARNLATAMNALHAKGYIVGDLNEANLLVSDTALVTLVDVDSFQVCDRERQVVYQCPVGRPDITPPEVLAELRAGRTFREIERRAEQDLFGLGILIFQLLMEGTHPFAGVFTGDGEPPPYAERIAAGHFPYSAKAGVPYRPLALAPPYLHLHPDLRELIQRCFVAGHENPSLRPTATDWQQALDRSSRTLIACPKNRQHLFWEHIQKCPWCERCELLGGRDPFPFIPGDVVPAIGADGQLAAVKLPPSGPIQVTPAGPDQPIKLKLAPRPGRRSWLRRRTAWERFLRRPLVVKMRRFLRHLLHG